MSTMRMTLGWDWNQEDWRRNAACRDIDPDMFFPSGHTGDAVEHIAAAKAVCGQCVVRAECLEFALEANQDDGIWGGTTEEERRRLRRSWLVRRRQPTRTHG